MAEFANQYSFVIFSCVAIIGIAMLLRMRRVDKRLSLATMVILFAFLGTLNLALRTGGSDVHSLEEAEAILNNQTPTLIQFFSNYCAGCMAERPEFDMLIRKIQELYPNQYNILRIDIHTAYGQVLRERYGFSFSPEYILLTGDGEEIWRGHSRPSLELIAQAAA